MIVIIGSYTGVNPRIAHSLNVSVFCSVKCLRYSSEIRTPDRTRIQKFLWRYLPYQRFFFGRGWAGGGGGLRDTYDCRGAQCILSVTLSRKFNNSDIFSWSSEYPRPMYLKKLCNKRFLSDISLSPFNALSTVMVENILVKKPTWNPSQVTDNKINENSIHV